LPLQQKAIDFYKDGHVFTGEEIKLLAIGNVIAFIVALLAIKTFITFLERRGFQLIWLVPYFGRRGYYYFIPYGA
jgi:undecaprenyl pyrophosphate phosphatase UppP